MFKVVSALVLALLLIGPVVAGTLPNDPVLQKPVTLAAKGEALSDVLKTLEKQTGVHLKAGSSIADQKLTVFVDKKPLKDVMQGLVTVFRYDWSAKSTGGETTYLVEEPKSVRSEINSVWQQAVSDCWKDLDATTKQRAALVPDETELQTELDHLESAAKTNRVSLSSEFDLLLRNRDNAVPATLLGDVAVSKLYCQLSPKALTALKEGQNIRFDSDSPDPEWKLPTDVVSLLQPFLKAQQLQRNEALINCDHFAVTLKAETDYYGVALRATVLCRPAPPKESDRWEMYLDVISSRNPEAAKVSNLPKFNADILLGQKIELTNDEIGQEAKTTAWTWDSTCYCTRSDLLALLHRKLGLQIIADYYSNYFPRDAHYLDHTVRGVLPFATLASDWGWDGKYLYVRISDIYNADACETPNRLMRNWQLAYAKRQYLDLDNLGQISQLNWSQLSQLVRFARFMGLESIDNFAGWERELGSRPIKFYGMLSESQKKAALAGGTLVSTFSKAQEAALHELLGENDCYFYRQTRARDDNGAIIAGIYDANWKRIDKPEAIQAPTQPEPVSLKILTPTREVQYFHWYTHLSSPWPQSPVIVFDAHNIDEALSIIQTGNPKASLADLRRIDFSDYQFVITLADGKEIYRTAQVPGPVIAPEKTPTK